MKLSFKILFNRIKYWNCCIQKLYFSMPIMGTISYDKIKYDIFYMLAILFHLGLNYKNAII